MSARWLSKHQKTLPRTYQSTMFLIKLPIALKELKNIKSKRTPSRLSKEARLQVFKLYI